MKINMPNFVSSRIGNASLIAQSHSPKVLFYAGIALMGGTVVAACHGTLKLEAVLEDVRLDREDVKTVVEQNPGKYSDRQIGRLNTYVTLKGGMRVVKLYLPAVTLGVAAVACLTSSHNQLTRRNAGLSAALAATERALDKYRSRVRNELGEERELQLWRDERLEEVEVTDENGKTKKVKKKVGGGHSPYARIWGRDTTTEWSPHEAYNFAKLRHVQEWGTMQLNSKGHLMLNEIHDELGLERTPAGFVVGWLSQKNGGADGYVDFGILGREDNEFLDFVTGREDHIMLDFNVDGEVWRQI